MTRIEIINSIIKKKNLKRYLEIGVRDKNDCFNHIECKIKHSVDPCVEREEEVDYKMYSDDFFRDLEENK